MAIIKLALKYLLGKNVKNVASIVLPQILSK